MSDQASSDKPVVLLRPAPQRIERIFSDRRAAPTPRALHRHRRRRPTRPRKPSRPACRRSSPSSASRTCPPSASTRAPKLRLVLNVEGNFFPNVDYEAAFAQGVNVAVCAPVYAQPVAEHALGLAIDLARGISREDRAFREGRERYVSAGNEDAILLRGAEMGILGYGNIGRRLLPLLAALPPGPHPLLRPVAALMRSSATPAWSQPRSSETLSHEHVPLHPGHRDRRVAHLLNADKMRLIPAGARVVLSSRAAVVDFDALVRERRRGSLPLRHRRLAGGAGGARPPRARARGHDPLGAPCRRHPLGLPRHR